MTKHIGGFIKFLVIILLLALIGFGVWIGLSAKRAGDHFDQAFASYQEAQASYEAEDYDQALAHVREAADATSLASEELSGMEWDIAEKVPVLGTDATVMRTIGSISGDLANQAALPVLDSWDQLTADGFAIDGDLDMDRIAEKFGQAVELAETLKSAGAAVDDCAARLDGMPQSHFGALNGWVDSLEQMVTEVDESFGEIEGIVDFVTGVSSAFSSLASDAA